MSKTDGSAENNKTFLRITALECMTTATRYISINTNIFVCCFTGTSSHSNIVFLVLYEKEISRIATLIPHNTHRSFSAQLFSSCTFLRVPSEGTPVCCGLENVAQTNLSKCQDGKERSIPKMEEKLPGDGLELRLMSFVICVITNTFM